MLISAPGTYSNDAAGPMNGEQGTSNGAGSPCTLHLAPRTSFQNGFTLIEMMVVIVIISLVAAIVLPLLPASDASDLRGSARRLATLIRYLGDRSVTTKSQFRMKLDLAENTLKIKKLVNDEEAEPGDPFFSRKFIAEGVTIEDIETPRLGKASEGVVNIDFDVSGLGEFIIIHLKGAKGDHYTVTAYPYGGKVEVQEGYQEITL